MVDILRRLGWDIETAEEAGLTGKIDDTKWVKHARRYRRISITFDELRAGQGARIALELRRYGGKIIRVQGGPEQDKYRAVGKLLFHFPDWYPFLVANDGVSIIADIRKQSCRNYTPEQYQQSFYPIEAEQFTQYLKTRKHRPFHHRKRKRKPPPLEQPPLVN